MSFAAPPPFMRATTKRVPLEPHQPTTSSASMQLLPASILPLRPTSLAHSVLTHLGPYHTQALPSSSFSSSPSSYIPPPTSPPLPPASSLSSSAPSLLDDLLRANKAREEADARLRRDVGTKVKGWGEQTATTSERGVRVMEERMYERARMQWQRWEEKEREDAGKGGSADGRVERPGVVGYSQAQSGGEKLIWEVKTEAAAADDKKRSKKDKERDEAERRQRELPLDRSPLSSPPPATVPPQLLVHEAVYIGSALPVTLSAYRTSEPLPVTNEARALLGASATPPASTSAASAGVGKANPLLSLYAGATLLPSPPVVSSVQPTSSLLPALQTPVSAAEAVSRELSRVEEESARCKTLLAEAGVWVHEASLQRGLGGGVGGLGSLGSGGSKDVWPVAFSSLADDPKDRRRKAGAEKGKAAVGKKKAK